MIFTAKLRTFNILKCYPTCSSHRSPRSHPQQSRSFLNKTEKVSRAPTFLFFHPFSCPSTDTISGYNVREEMALKKESKRKKEEENEESRVRSSRPRLFLNICSLLRISTFCRFVFANEMNLRSQIPIGEGIRVIFKF